MEELFSGISVLAILCFDHSERILRIVRVESSFPLRRVSWVEDPEETRETSRWNLDLLRYFARTLIIPKRFQIIDRIFIFVT